MIAVAVVLRPSFLSVNGANWDVDIHPYQPQAQVQQARSPR